MIPQPDEFFHVGAGRSIYRCLTVTDQGIEAFGGSADPGGRRAFRTFPLDAPFRVIQAKVNTRVNGRDMFETDHAAYNLWRDTGLPGDVARVLNPQEGRDT